LGAGLDVVARAGAGAGAGAGAWLGAGAGGGGGADVVDSELEDGVAESVMASATGADVLVSELVDTDPDTPLTVAPVRLAPSVIAP
jgi:hypothetical protein